MPDCSNESPPRARRGRRRAGRRPETCSDQYRQRAREQTSFEGCRAGDLAIELNESRHHPLHVDTYGFAARPPNAPRCFSNLLGSVVPRSEEQLHDRTDALEYAVRVERDDVQPAIIRRQVGSEPQESRWQLPAVQHQQHRRANLVQRAVDRHAMCGAAHVRQRERGAREVGAEFPAALRLEAGIGHQLGVKTRPRRDREIVRTI